MNKYISQFHLESGALALSFFLAASQSPAALATNSDDGSGAFATGRYRNLFVEAGHSTNEVKTRVNAAFEQLFHGDLTNQTVYYEAGGNSNGPLSFVTDIKHSDVRTEGLSYAMIICAEMDKKKEFDALWNWSMTYLYHDDPQDPGYGFFAWQARTNGLRMSQNIAPDGEEYYVMALFFAAARWGSGQGLYDYKAQALNLLHRLRHREWIVGPQPPTPGGRGGLGGGRGRVIGSGPLFDEQHKMVLFSPESGNTNALTTGFTDPSYHLPAFYELWARWGAPVDRDFWMGAAQNSRDYLLKAAHPVTALTPHDTSFDGSLRAGRGGFGGAPHFDYDACRTAGNWSVDWSWWGKEPRQRELSDKIQAFFESKGMDTYGCQYTLDGQPYPANNPDVRHAEGVVAVNAVASLAATNQERAKKFVEVLWNTPTPAGLERYYEGLLYMMAMLHCSGEFRIWAPR